jgi:hypothetical protein
MSFSEGQVFHRQFSHNSEQCLAKLDSIETEIDGVRTQLDNLEKNVDVTDYDSTVRAKNEMAQIIGNLEKLQANKVCLLRKYI